MSGCLNPAIIYVIVIVPDNDNIVTNPRRFVKWFPIISSIYPGKFLLYPAREVGYIDYGCNCKCTSCQICCFKRSILVLRAGCLLTCWLFFANILILNVNDNGNVSGNVSRKLLKEKALMKTSHLSSLGNIANLAPAMLHTRSISEDFHPRSGLSSGGVSEAISIIRNHDPQAI
jgi:hypothetical protein